MKTCPTCQSEYPDEVEYCPADGMKLRRRRQERTDPLVGKVLDGRWVIEQKIGEGGMGSVYTAHQQSVDRTVAIKTLRRTLVDNDEFVDRFFREVQVATRVAHPHCVTILDFGQTEDDTLYIAMEYLEGEVLTEHLERGNLTLEQIAKIGVQVASALSAAHDHHIVHRDLKPDNIFLLDIPGGGTFVKVLDFGIAKTLDSNTQMTKTGMIFGTPEYMSPEQCRGDDLDGRADLYSLGCILYELVGGRTPFAATTPMAVLMAHVNDTPESFSKKGISHVPPGLEQVIMRLLEKEPDRRYADATEVRRALEQELSQLDNPGAPATGGMDAAPAEIAFDQTAGYDTGEMDDPSAAQRGSGPIGGDTASAVAEFKSGPSAGKLAGIAAALLVLVVGAGVLTYVLMTNSSAAAESEEVEATGGSEATAAGATMDDDQGEEGLETDDETDEAAAAVETQRAETTVHDESDDRSGTEDEESGGEEEATAARTARKAEESEERRKQSARDDRKQEEKERRRRAMLKEAEKARKEEARKEKARKEKARKEKERRGRAEKEKEKEKTEPADDDSSSETGVDDTLENALDGLAP